MQRYEAFEATIQPKPCTTTSGEVFEIDLQTHLEGSPKNFKTDPKTGANSRRAGIKGKWN